MSRRAASRHRGLRGRIALLALLLLACYSADGGLYVARADTPPSPPSSTDIARYSLSGGQVQLELYNSPVGLPATGGGWSLRDPALASPTGGTARAARLPFDLRIATDAAAPSLAAMTSDDGITLGLALPTGAVASARSTRASGAGRSSATTSLLGAIAQPGAPAVVYPAAFPAPAAGGPGPRTPATAGADLALAPTLSGLDAEVVLRGPTQAGPFGLALQPDARTRLRADPDGSIRVVRTLPLFRDDGTQYSTREQTEYVIGAPVAREGAPDPALATTAAISPTAAISGTAGSATDTPAPSSTALAAPSATITATASPLPTTAATASGATPGVGIAPLATTLDATVPVTATLSGTQLAIRVDPAWLAAPGRAFPVVLRLPILQAIPAMHSGQAATLDGCAPAAPGVPGQLLAGTAGGCTRRGLLGFDLGMLWRGTPVQSATLSLYSPDPGAAAVRAYANVPPAGGPLAYHPGAWAPPSLAAAAQPGTAELPPLAGAGNWRRWDATLAVHAWVAGGLRANAGLSLGGDGPAVAFATAADAPALAPRLTITLAVGAFSRAENVFGLAGGPWRSGGSGSADIQPAYVRIEAELGCGPNSRDWTVANPDMSLAPIPAILDPRVRVAMVDFVENYSCGGAPNSPSDWRAQVQAFLNELKGYASVHGGLHTPLSFEIGNEPDTHPSDSGSYPAIFQAAANELHTDMGTILPGQPAATINTGGVTAPIANLSMCGGASTLNTIATAGNNAETLGSVPAAYLGAAIHPYGYATAVSGSPNAWTNYRSTGATTGNPCFQLDGAIGLWSPGTSPGGNLVFSEINYTSDPNTIRGGNQNDQSKVVDPEGSYLIDLFTWIWDNHYADASSPVCLFWFTGNDFSIGPLVQGGPNVIDYFGIYTVAGADKRMNPGFSAQIGSTSYGGVYCPRDPPLDHAIPTLAQAFTQASANPCQ